MHKVLSLVSVAAIVATAACNRGADAPPPPPQQAAADSSGEAAPAGAEQLGAAEAPEARKQSFEEFGRAAKEISRELKGSSGSMETVRRRATYYHEQARRMPGWFPEGSGPDAAPRTRAKQEIWTDPEGFARAQQAFLAAARDFDAAARDGNVERMRSQFPDLQASCKGCHDRYRGPERD